MIHLVSAAAMFGVIWVVQLVIYPLFDSLGEDRFPAYHESYMKRITWIVGPLMLLELTTGVYCALLFWNDPSRLIALLNVFLIGAIWTTTALVQVPAHNALTGGFEISKVQSLVSGNWIRTFLWTAHLALAVALSWKK